MILKFFNLVYVFCELMRTFRRETPMALETATVNLLAGGIMPVTSFTMTNELPQIMVAITMNKRYRM